MATLIEVSQLLTVSDLFWFSGGIAVIALMLTVALDALADRDDRRIRGQVNARADRQRLNALMATREQQ